MIGGCAGRRDKHQPTRIIVSSICPTKHYSGFVYSQDLFVHFLCISHRHTRRLDGVATSCRFLFGPPLVFPPRAILVFAASDHRRPIASHHTLVTPPPTLSQKPAEFILDFSRRQPSPSPECPADQSKDVRGSYAPHLAL